MWSLSRPGLGTFANSLGQLYGLWKPQDRKVASKWDALIGSPDETMDITGYWLGILLNIGPELDPLDCSQNDTSSLVISSDNPSRFGRYRHIRHDMLWCWLGVWTFGPNSGCLGVQSTHYSINTSHWSLKQHVSIQMFADGIRGAYIKRLIFCFQMVHEAWQCYNPGVKDSGEWHKRWRDAPATSQGAGGWGIQGCFSTGLLSVGALAPN